MRVGLHKYRKRVSQINLEQNGLKSARPLPSRFTTRNLQTDTRRFEKNRQPPTQWCSLRSTSTTRSRPEYTVICRPSSTALYWSPAVSFLGSRRKTSSSFLDLSPASVGLPSVLNRPHRRLSQTSLFSAFSQRSDHDCETLCRNGASGDLPQPACLGSVLHRLFDVHLVHHHTVAC